MMLLFLLALVVLATIYADAAAVPEIGRDNNLSNDRFYLFATTYDKRRRNF